MIEIVVVHGLVNVTTVLGDLANVALKTICEGHLHEYKYNRTLTGNSLMITDGCMDGLIMLT